MSWLLTAGAAPARENTTSPTYDVPIVCGARPAWLSSLRERLPPLLRTHPLLGTLSVHIERIEGPEAGYVGGLSSTVDASLGTRALRGATCEEVLDALSFIAALGLERIASSGNARGADTGLGSSPATALDGAAPAEEVDELSAAGGRSAASRSLRLGAVGFALLQGRLTPGQPVALGVAFRFAWSTPDWQPLILLGAYSSLPEQHRLAAGGSVRFEHWSTHSVACPLRFPRSATWGIRPCLDLDVGRSSGQAFDVAGADGHTAPWLSAGAQLRGELVLWDRLELVASAGAVAPFWHAHFFLFPDVESFTTPALGFRAGSYASLLF